LEVFIDGNEWDSDDVYTETLYGNLRVVGNDNKSQIDIKLGDFNGPGTYWVDNDNSYIRYYMDVADQSNFYFGLNDSIVVSSYAGDSPILIGSFSFIGLNSNGATAKVFSNGMFNGIDSISNVPTETLNIMLDQELWEATSFEVTENTNTGTLPCLHSQVLTTPTLLLEHLPQLALGHIN
jgi:hypothetical protein